ncbi:hypothetical protein CYMTET_54594 [Cymbomonas tetramitiformis]|uniref:Uncharacterized protein n=1 Tax=Cymbomonas tetramitiformis TaxID=36881 RepID=A0AAE0ENK6_9CHLO|nr:hypothetical protein CYMTET_54594 [Cymbomonas tetramitiformis]
MVGSTEAKVPATEAQEANTSGADVIPAGAPSGLEALVAQQIALMIPMMPQRAVVAAETASKIAATQMAGFAQSGDA